MLQASEVKEFRTVPQRTRKRKTSFVLLSQNKKTARTINESFESCKINNKFVNKSSVSDLSLRPQDINSTQVVLIDADAYPDKWVEMVLMATELPSVRRGGVVVLSTFGDQDVLMKAKNAGAAEFIVMPFDIIGVHQLIRKLPGFSLQIIQDSE